MFASRQPPLETEAALDHAMDALDELIETGAELSTLIDRCASIFGCHVGFTAEDGTSISAFPEHSAPPEPSAFPGKRTPSRSAPHPGHVRALPGGGSVWIAPEDDERYPPALDGEGAGPRRDRLLRRLGIAVRATTPRRETIRARTDDLRAVVDPALSDQDRRSAQRRLRLAGTTVTPVALAGADDGIATMLDQLRARATSVHHLTEGRVHMVLAQGLPTLDDLDIPEGLRCSYTAASPIEQAPLAWRKARSALRFTMPSTHATGPYLIEEAVVLNSARVGPYSILAEQLTPDQISRIEDVQRLDKLYQEAGAEMLHTLLAVAATESLRQAARVVHMHHNSVTYRVQRAEKMLGFSCTKPYGRSRLMFVLTLHRILDSWRQF